MQDLLYMTNVLESLGLSSQDQDREEGSARALSKMYAEILAMTPIRLHPGSHIPPPQAPPTNPYMGKRTEKFDERSNEVHVFSRDRKEAWDGYDLALDESNKEDVDSDATPPDKAVELAAAARTAEI